MRLTDRGEQERPPSSPAFRRRPLNGVVIGMLQALQPGELLRRALVLGAAARKRREVGKPGEPALDPDLVGGRRDLGIIKRADGDLDTIIAKALRLAPDDRYASVKHLADDLQRFLERRPIAARRAGLWYSARLAFARHRLAGGVE